MTPQRPDSRNARSKTMTTVDGADTHGALNQMPSQSPTFRLGVSESMGPRRFMEDAHSFVIDYAGVRGQGFFAVFDGHAGKHAAEWCGMHFHEYLLDTLRASPNAPIPDVLNEAFHTVDANLSKMSEESDGKMHSGCTAVTAFLRIEDENGKQSFFEQDPLTRVESPTDAAEVDSGGEGHSGRTEKRKANGSRSSHSRSPPRSSEESTRSSTEQHASSVQTPPATARRVLYCANAGDARGVLCRAGKAVRLTYDHKGSDKQEAKRITDAGGFMMSGRVNGVLAVTRSLGDSSMKEFVVGSPYTTETELCEDDEFLILACDGLWDVIDDQSAVDLVRDVEDAQEASQKLLDYALARTSDNVTVLLVRFKFPAAEVTK
ncbi:protein phosphatase 2C [Gloeophyllum trabeum ATCC 11539]|uniref:Protein phosphatase 2C n=1 Tax=Gloeophyllum trabeum (strain ATCC 11539 / FP-39264 / Madison 617) TaxID=670483 RepID=S7QCG8_GLOTA|nr:protein phosphatase 2C [Gloeophyllum trabeum ATCC 11539]EPQ57027.1 protein phosphatase 2C [Gloeophyllum trabeum ATCC 11539]